MSFHGTSFVFFSDFDPDLPLLYGLNRCEKYPRKSLVRMSQSLFSIYELPMRIIASLWDADIIHSNPLSHNFEICIH